MSRDICPLCGEFTHPQLNLIYQCANERRNLVGWDDLVPIIKDSGPFATSEVA